jgi:pyruvate dehydrogenase E1 component alpha subunit
MNLAQLWKLPVIYACENNLYNEYTHYSEATAGAIIDRPRAFGIACEVVDGQNVREVYAAASTCVERARGGDGPAFLQLNTYRYHGHHVGDIARAYYRPKSEEEEWRRERDPIAQHAAFLLQHGLADPAMLDQIGRQLASEMEQAVAFAIEAAYPDPGALMEDIYA